MPFRIETMVVVATSPPVSSPAAILAALLAVLSVVFWAQDLKALRGVFRVLPPILFCYFLPTALATLEIIPNSSPLYDWVKNYVLSASLVLLTISLDLSALVRLGPKALGVMLAGTVGVVVGGPIALLIWRPWLPENAWQAVSYLGGTWIGGSANGVAVQKAVGASDAAIAPLILVDVVVGYAWMGVLLFLTSRSTKLNQWLRADSKTLDALQVELQAYRRSESRAPSLKEMLLILTVGFGAAVVSHSAAGWCAALPTMARWSDYITPFAWQMLIVSVIGVMLSMTRIRALEQAGASRIGTLLLYVLIACIGAGGDFKGLLKSGAYLGVGVTWMAVHVLVIFLAGRMLRSPFFFVAVGSQANIGGAASAPVVAAAFNPLLAPVGVVLAILGYVLGTAGGILAAYLCRVATGH